MTLFNDIIYIINMGQEHKRYKIKIINIEDRKQWVKLSVRNGKITFRLCTEGVATKFSEDVLNHSDISSYLENKQYQIIELPEIYTSSII